MAVISSLSVLLQGNTSNLDAALDKTEKKVGNLKKKTEEKGTPGGSALTDALSSSIGQGLGAIPGGAALQGLVANITSGASGAKSAVAMLGGAFVGLAASIVTATAAMVAFGISRMSAIGQEARFAQPL